MTAEFIQKLKARDESAFRELIDTHKERVLNTCYRFIQNRDDVEDLSQEVFIEVYRSIDSFREDSQLATWIYRIAVNKSLDFIKKYKRRKRFAFMKSLSNDEAAVEPEQLINRTTPLDQLEQKERAHILNSAVNKLPENQRIALILSRYEGLSRNEIGEIMGTSVTAVDASIHRGKKNLQKQLYKYFGNNY